MFNPVKMARVEAVLLKKDIRAALRGLGAAGDMEFIPAAPGPDTAPSGPDDKSGPLAGCEELLGRIEALRRELGAGARSREAAEKMDYAAAAAAVGGLESRVPAALRRRRELAGAAARLAAEKEKLSVYAGLPLPAGGASELKFIYCAAGSIPAGNLPVLRAGLSGCAVLVELQEKGGRTYLAALAGRSSGAALSARLKAAGFLEERPPAGQGGTLGELAAFYSSESERARLALELAEAGAASAAAGAAAALAAAEAAALTERRLLEAERQMPRTASSVYVSGWVPEEETGQVAGVLKKSAGQFCAIGSGAAKPGSGAPVLLRPPRFFRPFAALVSGYGLPRYGEADPTVFAALTFVAMFGMMFGDAGHGAALCAGGLWLSRTERGNLRRAGRAAAACGLSAAFFGLAYGSFFGLESFKKYALWRDPLKGDPLAPLAAALLTGAAVISLGVALNIYNRLRLGDRLGAALDRFGAAGLAFYWPGLLLAAGRIKAGFALPVMAAAVLCWALKEPLLYLARPRAAAADGGFPGVAAEALAGAFEGTLLYLANTVSFVRLAAYAMSHSALLAAASALREAADSAWGAGSAAGVLAVIAGNAAAIGFEGLVAAVQALRLEYYEFFGKFFEGGGRPFRPFTLGIKGG